MAVLNALKKAVAASSSLFSKFAAPSRLLNANAGRCSNYYAHKQMPDMDMEKLKAVVSGKRNAIGVFGRAEGLPDLSGMKKLWWLMDEKMKKKSSEAGSVGMARRRLLDYSDQEDDGRRDFREELPWLKDRLDQVVRFRVEQNTVFIEGEDQENDERRISGRVQLPRYLDVMNGAQGEIKKGVLKLWLPDDDDMCPGAQSDDDVNYEYENIKYGRHDLNVYNDSSPGAAHPGDNEDGAAQPGWDGVMHPEEDDDEDSDEDEDDDSDDEDSEYSD